MATLTGTEGNDFFDDGTGTPPLGYTHHPGATTGDDFITLLGGDDIADAGPGVDTAFLDEALPYYDIRFHADATIDVTARFGTPDGDKELSGVEKLAFLTGTATVDVSAPRVARINTGSGADTVSMSGAVVGAVGQTWVELDRGLFDGDTNLMIFEDFGAQNLNTGGGSDIVTIGATGALYGLGWTSFTDSSAIARIAPPLTFDLGTGDDVLDLTSLEFASVDFTSPLDPLPPNPELFPLLAGASPVQVRLGAGNDTVLIGPNAGPVTVVDNRIGSEDPGVNVVESEGLAGNWIAFNSLGIVAGTQGVAVDMTTGLATSSIVGHQTMFSGMQNVAGTRGNDTITADHRANLIDFLSGIDEGDLGGQEAGCHDMVAFSAANGGLAIDLAAGTATGGTGSGLVNATFTGAEGAFGTNFADVCEGSAENDFIFGLGGNDTTDCGDGDGDIVGFTGNFAQYDIVQNADGSVTVTDLRTPGELLPGVVSDGVDTCSNVEIFRFADQLVCADAAGSAEFQVNLADVVTGATPATIVGGAGGDNTVKIALDGEVGAQVVSIEITPDTITPDEQDILLLFVGIAAAAGQEIRIGEGQHIEVKARDLRERSGIDIFVDGDYTSTALYSRTLTLHGGAGDDTLDASGVISNHRVVMNAGFGADTLLGGAGADILNGGSGNDGLSGGTNGDRLNGAAGADSLAGGDGNDVYFVDNAGDQVTELPGEGTDTVYASIDHVLGIGLENLRARGSVELTLTGNTLDNSLYGGASDDTLSGGSGNDRLIGGVGADTMVGDTGDDIYYVDNVGDQVTELPGGGTDTVYASIDYVLGTGLENLRAQGSVGLTLAGNAVDNKIVGGVGNDTLYGGEGNDTLYGRESNDRLQGDAGNDTLVGGGERDTLSGNAGLDIFKYGSISDSSTTTSLRDLITDFTIGSDKIHLADIDANTLLGGNQAFTFIGAAGFSNTAGQLRVTTTSSATILSSDVNGDSTADFAIGLTGVLALTAGDFIL